MPDRSLKGSNGPRPFFAVLGAFLALAPSLGSGCGGSTTTAAVPDAGPSVDASGPPLGHVVTTGGGAPGAGSSSSGAVVDPFGGSSSSGGPSDDSGAVSDDSGVASSSSSSGSGSSSGNGSSSGGGSTSSSSSGGGDAGGSSGDSGGSSDAALDSGSDGPADFCASYTSPMCNGSPCDLKTHTCCVTFTLKERCLAGANAKCASNEAAVHCGTACDCTGGQSCCGIIDTLVGSVQTGCQTLNPSQSGGNCPPYPWTVSQASAQLCGVSSECRNGQPCIYQTCVYGAQAYLCGLQSQSPYNCKAN